MKNISKKMTVGLLSATMVGCASIPRSPEEAYCSDQADRIMQQSGEDNTVRNTAGGAAAGAAIGAITSTIGKGSKTAKKIIAGAAAGAAGGLGYTTLTRHKKKQAIFRDCMADIYNKRSSDDHGNNDKYNRQHKPKGGNYRGNGIYAPQGHHHD